MSDCKNHKKEVAGISDMKVLAEAIGDLHYEALAELFGQLSAKIFKDAQKDDKAGRIALGSILYDLNYMLNACHNLANRAWTISKPFMESITPQNK